MIYDVLYWIGLWLLVGFISSLIVRIEHGKASLKDWAYAIAWGGVTALFALLVIGGLVFHLLEKLNDWMERTKV